MSCCGSHNGTVTRQAAGHGQRGLRLLAVAAHQRLAEQLRLESEVQQSNAHTLDYADGLAAFREKRRPKFTGHSCRCLTGRTYVGLNGGRGAGVVPDPQRPQGEIDRLWGALIKDCFGMPWQVIPKRLFELIQDPDADARRATAATMRMKRLDVATTEKVADGG